MKTPFNIANRVVSSDRHDCGRWRALVSKHETDNKTIVSLFMSLTSFQLSIVTSFVCASNLVDRYRRDLTREYGVTHIIFVGYDTTNNLSTLAAYKYTLIHRLHRLYRTARPTIRCHTSPGLSERTFYCFQLTIFFFTNSPCGLQRCWCQRSICASNSLPIRLMTLFVWSSLIPLSPLTC